MRRLAFALAAAAMTAGACSLGLRESQVGEPATGGSSNHTTGPSVGGGGSTATLSSTVSTATVGVLCGDKTCDSTENCSTCPGDCLCFTGMGCKAGKCQDCPATFAVDIDAPHALATRGLVASNGELFLAPTETSGGNTNASLAEVDACFGTAATKLVPAPGGDPSVGGPVALGDADAEIVAACGFAPSMMDPGAALIFGGRDGPVTTWQQKTNSTPGNDLLVDVAAAGDVWMAAGVRDVAPQNWIVYGDLKGEHLCTKTDVFASALGAAMATDGTKLYVAGTDSSSSSISIATFDASACDPASCSCNPASTVGSIVIAPMYTAIGAMLFAAGQLYVAGSASDDGVSYYAFVTTVIPATGTLGPVFHYDPTMKLDGFVALAYDGTHILAGGYEGANAPGDVSMADAVVVGLDPQLGGTPAFVTHPANNASSVVGLATDPSQPGVFFAQIDKSPGAAVYRCKSSSAPCP